MSENENPYAAPRANVEAATSNLRGSVVKALIIGTVVDVAVSIVLGGVLFVIWTDRMGLDPIAAETERVLASSVPFMLVALLIGSAAVVLGGYVAARVARMNKLRIGIYFAVLMLLTNLVTELFMGTDAYPVWYSVASYLVAPMAAVGGVLLGPGPPVDRPDAAG